MIPDVTLDLSSKIWILDSDPLIHPSLQQATARRPDSAPHFTLIPPLRHHSCKTQRARDRRQCPESESDPGSRAFGRGGLGRRACLGSASGGLQLLQAWDFQVLGPWSKQEAGKMPQAPRPALWEWIGLFPSKTWWTLLMPLSNAKMQPFIFLCIGRCEIRLTSLIETS